MGIFVRNGIFKTCAKREGMVPLNGNSSNSAQDDFLNAAFNNSSTDTPLINQLDLEEIDKIFQTLVQWNEYLEKDVLTNEAILRNTL
ncbi:hypothetical protein BET10_07255 [Pseudoalteromonas amylolytica]|uniref:Uncharacterized protein n=1 Tax=Pseudoalteromonas amylolytica TaxID=1859457 RepID=A0A1S1MY30_9GAMM|nr:hypothetical protein BFC16_06150 [Pseudoalteromonas sp. JW3]OHU92116.1 hypothetical protein BET10_07255 [Pseudoalteromonas amylolytica]